MKISWTVIFLWYLSIVCIAADENEVREGDIRFFLHTRELGETELTANNLGKVNIEKPIKLIIHGWNTNHTALWQQLVTDAFLRKGDYNVILVDWAPLAELDPFSTIQNVPTVGTSIGTTISQLHNESPIPLEDFHIVGHSLGAPIAGFVGKTITKLTKSKVSRITGLDPFVWILDGEHGNLEPTDAALVDIIHTTDSEDDLIFNMGHIHFFPNGGAGPQPGCDDSLFDGCSHMRVTYLFAEELENERGFLGTRCDSMQYFKEGLCRNERRVTMGGDLKLSDSGNYYFYTNPSYPYSMESTIEF